MTYDETEYAFTLSTGKRIFVMGGILGIPSKPTDNVEFYGGFDDTIYARGSDFTTEERLEIADYAIALWRAWAERSEVPS